MCVYAELLLCHLFVPLHEGIALHCFSVLWIYPHVYLKHIREAWLCVGVALFKQGFTDMSVINSTPYND